MLLIGILVGLIILMVIVVVHELGHYLAAKKSGVVVEEFGIGIPPKAWSKKLKSGMIFSLNWLPIGGFCKMRGESDDDKRKGSFGAATYWQKTKILFAGVTMNWLFAIIILTILAATGLPKMLPNQFQMSGGEIIAPTSTKLIIDTVKSDSPAATSGLKSGDEIVWLGDDSTPAAGQSLSEWTSAHKGETVQIGIRESGSEEIIIKDITLSSEGEYYLGVSGKLDGYALEKYRSKLWQAPIVGVVTTAQFTYETVKGVFVMLWNLVSGLAQQLVFWNPDIRDHGSQNLSAAGDAVSGPVGIVGVLFPMFLSMGFDNLMFLAAIISISLAVMNILPIPALDGGRWSLITYHRLRKKPLTKEKEEKIVSTSFMVLMGLFVLIAILDITRLF